jgi:hypothetical protein
MPNHTDYLKAIYNRIKTVQGSVSVSEEEFVKKMNDDPAYARKVHGAVLKDAEQHVLPFEVKTDFSEFQGLYKPQGLGKKNQEVPGKTPAQTGATAGPKPVSPLTQFADQYTKSKYTRDRVEVDENGNKKEPPLTWSQVVKNGQKPVRMATEKEFHVHEAQEKARRNGASDAEISDIGKRASKEFDALPPVNKNVNVFKNPDAKKPIAPSNPAKVSMTEYVAHQTKKSEAFNQLFEEAKKNLAEFTTTTDLNRKMVDRSKLRSWLNKYYKDRGEQFDVDGEFADLLHSQINNRLKYELIRPEIESEADKIVLAKTGKSIKDILADNSKEEASKIIAPVNVDFENKIEEVKGKYTPEIQALNNNYKASVEELKTRFSDPKWIALNFGTNPDVKEVNRTMQEEAKKVYEDYFKNHAALSANQRRELSALKNAYEQAVNDLSKNFSPSIDPQLQGIVNTAYQKAATNVFSKQDKDARALGDLVEIAASSIPGLSETGARFIRGLKSGTANVVNGVSTFIGNVVEANWTTWMKDQANDLAESSLLPANPIESLDDLLNPKKFAQSAGEQLPQQGASILAALALRVPAAAGVVGRGMLQGAIQASVEEMQRYSEVYNNLIDQGVDPGTAHKKGMRVWNGFMRDIAFGAIQMQAVLGKLGTGSMLSRYVTGTATELATEIPQEIMQTREEEDAMSVPSSQRASAKDVALNVVPSVVLVGGPGAISSSMKAGEGLVPKFVYNAIAQQVLNSNKNTAKAAIEFAAHNGAITPEGMAALSQSVESIAAYADEAKNNGLNNKQSQAYISLMLDVEQANNKLIAAEQSGDQQALESAQKELGAANRDAQTFLKTKQGNFAYIKDAEGNVSVVTHDEVSTLLQDEQFVQDVKDGKTKVELKWKKGGAKNGSELAGKLYKLNNRYNAPSRVYENHTGNIQALNAELGIETTPTERLPHTDPKGTIGQPATMQRNGEIIQGTMRQEGQTLVFENDTIVREIGNIDQVTMEDVDNLGITVDRSPQNNNVTNNNVTNVDELIDKYAGNVEPETLINKLHAASGQDRNVIASKVYALDNGRQRMQEKMEAAKQVAEEADGRTAEGKDAKPSIDIPNVGDEVTGDYVASQIAEIGDSGPTGTWIGKIARMTGRKFRAMKISLDDLFASNSQFANRVEQLRENKKPTAYQQANAGRVTNAAYAPAVMSNGEIVDGYGRLAQQYINGEKYAVVYNDEGMAPVKAEDQSIINDALAEAEEAMPSFQKATPKQIKKISDRLSKKFGFKVIVDQEAFNTVVAEEQQKGNSVDSQARGVMDRNTKTIIINPSTATLDTPVHEFTHVLVDIIKQKAPELYARATQLITTQKPQYIEQAIVQGYKNPVDEALVQFLGEMGAFHWTGNRAALNQHAGSEVGGGILKSIINWIKSALGISSGTKPFGEFNLRDLVNYSNSKLFNESAEVELSEDGRSFQAPAGSRLFNAPLEEAKRIADQYIQQHNLPIANHTNVTKINKAFAFAVADAYAEMKDDPFNPEVQAAYNQMTTELLQQYNAMEAGGYVIEIYTGEGEPYASSEEMIEDLRENKRMFILSSETDFGSGGVTEEMRQRNAMLKSSGFNDANGKPLLINDIFRGVHDFFGHSVRGNSFGPIGEENAWDEHAAMFTPLARKALTTETRGQNSWVNFGSHMRNENGELIKKGEPGYLSPKERPFAEQKIGLLPDWATASYQELDGGREFQKGSRVILKDYNKPHQQAIREAKKRIEASAKRYPEAMPLTIATDRNGKVKFDLDRDGNPYVLFEQSEYELLNGAKEFSPKMTDAQIVEKYADKIADEARVALTEESVKAGLGWYSNVRKVLAQKFGANIEIFGQLLAATSARTPVRENFKQAIEALRNYSLGFYDEVLNQYHNYVQAVEKATPEQVQQMWIEDNPGKRISQYNEEDFRRILIGRYDGLMPLRSGGKKYNANTMKVLQALYGNWLKQTQGPKTKNFAGNLTGRSVRPTIDVWAARTTRRIIYQGNTPQWRVLPYAEGSVKSNRTKAGVTGDYPFAEAVMQRAADKLGMAGDDLQALLWFHEKHIWADNGWTGAAGEEKSSFEDQLDEVKVDRYQVGITTFKDDEQWEREGKKMRKQAISDMLKEVRKIPGLVAARVTETIGGYGGYTEPSIDLEFSVKPGSNLDRIFNSALEIANKSNQESFFMAKIVDQITDTARPIVEVGFKTPQEDSKIVDQMLTKLADDFGVGGHTIARDTQGKILGFRIHLVPEIATWFEFNGNLPEQVDFNKMYNEWESKVSAYFNTLDNATKEFISYLNRGYAEHDVVNIAQYEQRKNTKPFSGGATEERVVEFSRSLKSFYEATGSAGENNGENPGDDGGPGSDGPTDGGPGGNDEGPQSGPDRQFSKQDPKVGRFIAAMRKRGAADWLVLQGLEQAFGLTPAQAQDALNNFIPPKNSTTNTARPTPSTPANMPTGSEIAAVNNSRSPFQRNIVTKFKEQFSSWGVVGKDVHVEKEKMAGRLSGEMFKALALTKRAERLIKETGADIDDVDLYLRGQQPNNLLPQQVIIALDEMRSHIDNLTDTLINEGLISSPELAATLINNKGSYLTRSYALFNHEDVTVDNVTKKLRNVDERAVNAALELLYKEQLPIITAQNPNATPEEIVRLTMIAAKNRANLILSEEISNFKNGGKLGAKDLGTLKNRKDIDPAIRALMGEYTDPLQNYATTIYKVASIVTAQQFLTNMRNNMTGKLFWYENDTNRPGDATVRIAGENSEVMSPLNGMYTYPEVAKAFEEAEAEYHGIVKILMAVAGTVKGFKTVFSVSTHVKNILGNLGFVVSNGHFNVNAWAKVYNYATDWLLNKPNEELFALSQKLFDLGVLNTSVGANELRSYFNSGKILPSQGATIHDSWTDKTKQRLRQFGSWTTNMYQKEDDIYKIIAYLNESSRYSNAMFGSEYDSLNADQQAEVDEKVADIIKNTYPTFTRVPAFVKSLSKGYFIGNFLSFQVEAIRTQINSLKLGWSELKDGDTRAIGASRIVGATFAAAMRATIVNYSAALVGAGYTGLIGLLAGDDEEKDAKERAMRLYTAEWSKNSDLVYSKTANGQFSYSDLSSSDPFGYSQQVLNQFFRDVDDDKGLAEAGARAASKGLGEFLDPDMTMRSFMGAIYNEDFYGNEIYNPEDDNLTKTRKLADYLRKQVQPGTISTAERITKASTDDKEGNLSKELIAISGFRTYDVDVLKKFKNVLYNEGAANSINPTTGFVARLKNAEEIYYRVASRPDLSAEEKQAEWQKANDAVINVLKETRKYYQAAVTLGVKPDDLVEVMLRARLGRPEILSVLNDQYDMIYIKPKH